MTRNGQQQQHVTLKEKMTHHLFPMLATILLVLPLFSFKLKHPSWEGEQNVDMQAPVVDISSGLNDPAAQEAIHNILLWAELRRPDAMLAPDATAGFLSAIPSQNNYPDTSAPFSQILERRLQDFNDHLFSGETNIPMPTPSPLPLPGNRAAFPSFPSVVRHWNPPFSDYLPKAAAPNAAKAPQIVWTDDAGKRLIQSPRMEAVPEESRKKAGFTQLELMPGVEMPLPRIVVRTSCGNPKLDLAAVSALSAYLGDLTEGEKGSLPSVPTLLNVFWNLREPCLPS